MKDINTVLLIFGYFLSQSETLGNSLSTRLIPPPNKITYGRSRKPTPKSNLITHLTLYPRGSKGTVATIHSGDPPVTRIPQMNIALPELYNTGVPTHNLVRNNVKASNISPSPYFVQQQKHDTNKFETLSQNYISSHSIPLSHNYATPQVIATQLKKYITQDNLGIQPQKGSVQNYIIFEPETNELTPSFSKYGNLRAQPHMQSTVSQNYFPSQGFPADQYLTPEYRNYILNEALHKQSLPQNNILSSTLGRYSSLLPQNAYTSNNNAYKRSPISQTETTFQKTFFENPNSVPQVITQKRSPESIPPLKIHLSPPPKILNENNDKTPLKMQFTQSPRMISTPFGKFSITKLVNFETISNNINETAAIQSIEPNIVETKSSLTNDSSQLSFERISLQNQKKFNISENNFDLNEIFYPPVSKNKIVFPHSRESEDNTWQPVFQGAVFPSVQDSSLISSNTFAKAFANLRPTSNFQLSDINPSHHLFISTTARPITNRQSLQNIHNVKRFTPTNWPNIEYPSASVKRNILPSKSNFDLENLHSSHPIEYDDPEHVFHLNSTTRIKQLIQFLKDYLKGPAHQLSNEFASEVETNKKAKLTFNEERSHLGTSKKSLNFENKFQNGFLALLYPNVSNTLSTDDFVLNEIPNIDARPTPIPVKLNPFSDILTTFSNPSFDLLQSPSFSSLLTIAKLTAENNISKSLNELFKTNSITPDSNDPRQHEVQEQITVSTKVSRCPVLYEQLDLVCEVKPDSAATVSVECLYFILPYCRQSPIFI